MKQFRTLLKIGQFVWQNWAMLAAVFGMLARLVSVFSRKAGSKKSSIVDANWSVK